MEPLRELDVWLEQYHQQHRRDGSDALARHLDKMEEQ